jgi:amino acid adenylation domain-containing protein
VEEKKLNEFWKQYLASLNCFADKVIIKEASEEKEYTFCQVDEESNSIADYIEEHNEEFSSYVGISSGKSIKSIITMLGVLKSGRAYIPIDDKMAIERKKYILNQCGNSYCDYDTAMNSGAAKQKRNLSSIPMQASAYVIYTSGSTGTPKGVEISYSNMLTTFYSVNAKFNVSSSDVLMNLAPFDFDLSVYDIFNTFMIGATLIIMEDSRNMPLIIRKLVEEQVTVWNSVPMVMDMLINYMKFKHRGESIPYLKNVFLSGDKTSVNLANEITKFFPNADIISMGGATECAIWSNYFNFKELETEEKIIPYGYALDNQQMMILDDDLNLCDIDQAGDIYIGGKGVAKGYYLDPEKTKNAFITTKEFGRIYKTGDVGVLTSHGYINFLGRSDRQCKVRGYRVELDEIENVINQIINTRCAVGLEEGNITVKITNYKGFSDEHLKEYMVKRLPGYMIPTKIDLVKSLDITKNGKINYKKLFSC